MESSPDLLPSQRNEILEFIRLSGVDPAPFEWRKRESWYSKRWSPVVAHKSAGFHFMVDFTSHSMAVDYSPAKNSPHVQESFDRPDWAYVRPHLAVWTDSLARELNTPDLWSELTGHHNLFSDGPGEETNTPFAPDELLRIDAALTEIRELARSSYELNADQAEVLNRRLKYLESAARRLGRLDWRNVLLSVIVQLVFQAVLSSARGQEVLALADKLLRSVFGHVPELPLPPT